MDKIFPNFPWFSLRYRVLFTPLGYRFLDLGTIGLLKTLLVLHQIAPLLVGLLMS